MASNPIIDPTAGSVQTTDATLTTVLSVTPPASNLGMVMMVRVVGRSATDGSVFGGIFALTCENTAGTMLIVGTPTQVHRQLEGGIPGATFAAGNGTLLVQVTGLAANTIDWVAWAETTYHQT